ncbi:MAG: alkaline phytoceramidase [Candidatus Acidiferrales bacterium]
MNRRVWLLIAALGVTIVAVFLLPPIPQNEAYHNFADRRTLLGIPRCLDVLSNVPFLIVGVWGIWLASSKRVAASGRFLDSREGWAYLVFFIGVALTAFGSSYYHLMPNDSRLVWDRMPMTVGFMGLLAATIDERISVKTGLRSIAPLVILGIGSVLYWRVSQSQGHGDLRPYALVQFGSMLAILLLIVLFPPRYTRGADLLVSFGIYGLAKVFEAADRPIFGLGGIVSGHTLKHLTAALSAYWIARMLIAREPIVATPKVPDADVVTG